jgi:hypothetical protein
MEGYSPQVVENFLSACMKNSDARTCRCALDAVRRRFTIDEYRAIEVRIAQRDVPRELLAVLDDCRH